MPIIASVSFSFTVASAAPSEAAIENCVEKMEKMCKYILLYYYVFTSN